MLRLLFSVLVFLVYLFYRNLDSFFILLLLAFHVVSSCHASTSLARDGSILGYAGFFLYSVLTCSLIVPSSQFWISWVFLLHLLRSFHMLHHLPLLILYSNQKEYCVMFAPACHVNVKWFSLWYLPCTSLLCCWVFLLLGIKQCTSTGNIFCLCLCTYFSSGTAHVSTPLISVMYVPCWWYCSVLSCAHNDWCKWILLSIFSEVLFA